MHALGIGHRINSMHTSGLAMHTLARVLVRARMCIIYYYSYYLHTALSTNKKMRAHY